MGLGMNLVLFAVVYGLICMGAGALSMWWFLHDDMKQLRTENDHFRSLAKGLRQSTRALQRTLED